MPYSLGIYTLGCKVNQYESEAIAEAAQKRGFCIKPPTEACDAYIINTCTVTGESDRKSRQLIRRALSANPCAAVAVTGCSSQVAPDSIEKISGVDYICGNADKLSCVDALLSILEGKEAPKNAVTPIYAAPFEKMNIEHFPRTRAYIKIEDGCESHCTYCIIPKARGKIRSKSKCEVLSELSTLAAGGCREVVLTGIETASYGIDLENYRLADLLEDADRLLAGRARIRLGSLDPSLIKPQFIERIAALPSLAPHFHLSMQSGCDKTLARMKRKYNTEMALLAMDRLRTAIPDVQFTTDLIVGFPGETDEDFETTLEFVNKARFLSAHVFAYSKRNGTEAAKMPDQVAESVKRERSARLIAECKRISDEILKEQIGKEVSVLFETYSNGYAVGHTPSFIEIRAKSDIPLHSTVKNVCITDIGTGKILDSELGGVRVNYKVEQMPEN
ncbi:MAG: tRNA (N(6)-L-threonylcarbamoyladenosine(37)-C(2))-methylthiotransferase MtaB [Ruminococcaceae bacterium]|nr:tRNA (N(6)-L-threonylcarbamoyladenosine(37)-C(2))-methylthiotransferase MtaB [Oscillospiraceae bacterium]